MNGIPAHRHTYCRHPSSWFDRSLCGRDDWMHTRCATCGRPLDGECGKDAPLCVNCGEPRPAAVRRSARRAGKDAAPKITEADFMRQVTDLATVLGWDWAHFRPAQTARGWRTPVQGTIGEGFPDLVLVRRDRIILAELKRDGAKTTPKQDAVLDKLRVAAPVYVWRPSDFESITAILR